MQRLPTRRGRLYGAKSECSDEEKIEDRCWRVIPEMEFEVVGRPTLNSATPKATASDSCRRSKSTMATPRSIYREPLRVRSSMRGRVSLQNVWNPTQSQASTLLPRIPKPGGLRMSRGRIALRKTLVIDSPERLLDYRDLGFPSMTRQRYLAPQDAQPLCIHCNKNPSTKRPASSERDGIWRGHTARGILEVTYVESKQSRVRCGRSAALRWGVVPSRA